MNSSIFLFVYWLWNSESDNLFCSNWYLYTNCYYRGCHNPILPISSCEIVIGHKGSGFEEFFIYPCNIKSDACDYEMCTIHKRHSLKLHFRFIHSCDFFLLFLCFIWLLNEMRLNFFFCCNMSIFVWFTPQVYRLKSFI